MWRKFEGFRKVLFYATSIRYQEVGSPHFLFVYQSLLLGANGEEGGKKSVLTPPLFNSPAVRSENKASLLLLLLLLYFFSVLRH